MANTSLFPKGAMIAPGNDNLHNLTDLNQGGSPRPDHKKNVQIPQRGGFGQSGQKKYGGTASGKTHPTAGNPASRGGFSGVARGGAFNPEKRVPGHGGSPQHRERESSNFGMRASFGANGQGAVNRHAPGQLPSYGPSNPKPRVGNVSGRSQKLIAGRFKRVPMGARASQGDNSGKYGSAPVTSNT